MPRMLGFGVILLACAATGFAADQRNAAGRLVRPGVPHPPKQQMGPPLSNPASDAARLYRASPEERDRALEKLPPRLQEQLRAQLERFDAMPKEQQQVLILRAERFAALSAEQKAAFRQQMQALSKLPPDRRAAVGRALRTLQPLAADDRQEVVAGEEFKSRFSPEERAIIAGLSEVMLPPL